MADPDLYFQCGSWLRVGMEDAKRFPHAIGKHPADLAHPGEEYVSCDLIIRHAGDCESWMDTLGAPGDPEAYCVWFTWQTRTYMEGPATEYQSIEARKICPQESRGYACGRPPEHDGGHAFNTEV